MLSNQLNQIIDEQSNIHKFYKLFDIEDGNDCIEDILNFVWALEECDDYNVLEENTTLQKLIKGELINETTFNLGIGRLKNNFIGGLL